VEKTLILNTDKVYGEGLGQTEDKSYVHGEPYQASKCCQGFIARSYMDTYGMKIVMPHSCNVFGYDPYSDRIVPNVVKKCLQGGSPIIFTNDDSLREYIYIEDMLDALTRLMKEDSLLGSYNISTGWVYNQKDVVLEILKHFPNSEPKYVEGDLPPQILEQSLESNRWDFEPSWTFGAALKATIEFFDRYQDDWSYGKTE
jgi:dTDP-glucose 4,6-dehydratase